MRSPRKAYKTFIIKSSLLMMCFMSLSLGLGLCLIKSPDSRATTYLEMVSQYQNQMDASANLDTKIFLAEEKQILIHQAIMIDPDHAKSWQDLSMTLAQLNDLDSALKSRDIAFQLSPTIEMSIEKLQASLPDTMVDNHKIALSDNALQHRIAY